MDKPIFAPASEASVTRAMISRHWKKFDEYIESDVIVVGAGPAGLVAAYELAKNGVKVMLLERNNYLGGGMYLGGYGVPDMVVRKPGNFILDELNIKYEETEEGLCVVNAPLVAGKLIAAACEAGAFVVNLTLCEDVVINDDNEVGGVVINWAPVKSLPREITCVDPVAMESKVVIGTTGHDEASIAARLAKAGLIAPMKGMGMMNIRASEDEVVKNTVEVYPGVILAGMEAAAYFGLHRMGPTFGAMFLSGKRAADVAMTKLGVKKASESTEIEQLEELAVMTA
ncbi:sulfide-dependent adenosine diphosphate thiazole synthase [Patescibacteria group bacterium]|nr:sulfide-dependent adenosine diphosphate thiazole synthase [Patescibacteria group bacterium]